MNSTSSLRRPPFLCCSDCPVFNWTFQASSSSSGPSPRTPTGAEAVIKFCAVHRTNFRVPSVQDSLPPPASVPGVATQSRISPAPPAVPTQNAAQPAPQPPTQASSSAQPPALPPSDSGECLDYYQKCLQLSKTCERLGRGYDKQSFRRKQPIAE